MFHSIALLLSDGRFPSGSHAHSGGVEQACDNGWIVDVDDLADYLRGRLRTHGTLAAYAAAVVCAHAGCRSSWPAVRSWVDEELDARMASPAARSTSRQQGGQLMRSALSIFDSWALSSLGAESRAIGREPHYPVVQGVVAAAANVGLEEAAAAAGYAAVAGPASAGLRLLGLDPSQTAKVLAGLCPEIDGLAQDAAGAALRPGRPLGSLPPVGAPAADLLAEEHFLREGRLFAS